MVTRRCHPKPRTAAFGPRTAVFALVVLAGSCSASIDVELADSGAPVTAEAPTATPRAPAPTESDETPTPEPEPAAAPTEPPVPTAPAAPEPTDAPVPEATTEPLPIEIVVAPDAPLLGISIGTEAGTAIAGLEALIGPPDSDTDWYVGCALNGDGLDERLLRWGDLNVYFDIIDDAPTFTAWGYDLRVVDGGFPEPELVRLPGGAALGDPIDEVAAAAGLDVRYDEVFDINRVGEPGYEVVSDAPPGAASWGAFVPNVPACE